MKKSVLILMAMILSLMLTMSVNDVMARSGGSGEGDDCLEGYNYKNVGQPFKGTLIGWLEDNKIKLCTPEGSPLIRGSNPQCSMEISCTNPYIFGTFPLPEKPKDMMGWCRYSLSNYDSCSYDVLVSGYESIDSSKPKYIDATHFTVDIVIMPLYVAP